LSDRPRYQLILEALPSGIPPIVRLRHLLKLALRVTEFRCVNHVELAAPDSGDSEEREPCQRK
jgi:hypothetical protein